jgi:hypothetical protein
MEEQPRYEVQPAADDEPSNERGSRIEPENERRRDAERQQEPTDDEQQCTDATPQR